jgi:hypothetical protein
MPPIFALGGIGADALPSHSQRRSWSMQTSQAYIWSPS